MRLFGAIAILGAVWGLGMPGARAQDAGPAPVPVQLALDPTLSPDGTLCVFSWGGDLWVVPTVGGTARRLTAHPANERDPFFSPDGTTLAFTSDREDGRQVFTMPAAGGHPTQRTWHTEGYTIDGWYPDGTALLCSAGRDHFWRHQWRFVQVSTTERRADRLLFDAAGRGGALSPDGRRLLFMREGEAWWRKGYRGSRAAQIWLYDLAAGTFSQVAAHPTGCRWPLWRPDGNGFWYVCGKDGAFNLYERDLASGQERQLTRFTDDGVIQPTAARDGSVLVFRHLGDLYRLRPDAGAPPTRIDVRIAADLDLPRTERRTLNTATAAAITADGLEWAFCAGGDLWVMDTELREPIAVTDTPEEERDAVFSADGSALFFVSERDGQPDIWKAERGDPGRYWWQQRRFTLTRITEDGADESNLRLSPDGQTLAYIKGQGDLWLWPTAGGDARRLIASWSAPEFDWSPDSKWLVYAQSDDDFNRDIWIQPLDGHRERFNLSRHPDNESDPVWSPDGRAIAFTGRRNDQETDIHFVWLRAEDDTESARDRTVEKALEKMRKGRPAPKPAAAPGETPAGSAPATPAAPAPGLTIDFDRIHERIRRVAIPNTAESGLLWSPDSKRLAFVASIDGKRGTYVIEPRTALKPRFFTPAVVAQARWLAKTKQIAGLVDGVPTLVAPTGAAAAQRFAARQELDLSGRSRAAFDQAWRTMRDWFYDARLNNRNWDAVRRKYRELAAGAIDPDQLQVVIALMLGELNGSHLGFYPRRAGGGRSRAWPVETAHLGLRYVDDWTGPGWKIRDVLRDGPADQCVPPIQAGELVLQVDGTDVDPALDPALVLNGPLDRDVRLTLRDAEGTERTAIVRPINYAAARRLLYEQWVHQNRTLVDTQSGGSLGYLHIAGMNWPSFQRFEAELYAVGAGKDGLVIDVRENGGGFTTDHLLTVLTQPDHAITVPRGGGAGYPHDRRVYATWNKPIVVLCNQNSFSNAEIFSHAIKTLQRGQVVGVQTAGGVISTGATQIMDVGTLRLPFRGWFVGADGADMELNGCLPHHVLWPEPGEWPSGVDRQLAKGVEVLTADVVEWKARPRPRLRYASEDRK